MDPTMLLGLISQIGGGLAGQLAAMPDQAAALQLLQQARDEYGKINVPQLQQLVAAHQGQSGMAGVNADPRLRAAQMDALTQMQDLAKSGGLNLSDKAALNDVNNRLATTEAANRGAVRNSLQARGLDSSGAELALSQHGGQQAAEEANQRGLHVAGMAQQRALDSMMGAGRLGSQMEGQQFNEAAAKAQAQDSINRYNTSLQQAANQYNVQIPQQQYEDAMQRARGMSGADVGLSQYQGGQAQQQRQFWGGLGQGTAQGLNAYGQYQRGLGGSGGGPLTSPYGNYGTQAAYDPNQDPYYDPNKIDSYWDR